MSPKLLTFNGFLSAAVIVTVVAAGMPHSAWANSTGRTGASGKSGPICNACHSGGERPDVRFEGPAEVAAGAQATFVFVVTRGSPNQQFAGFNVAASAGNLAIVSGQGARLSGGELTHSSPKEVDENGETSWQFIWRAPATTGMQRLFGAGNSVNGNGSTTGDRAAPTDFDVEVVPGQGMTATPTRTASPTPPIATATSLLPTLTRTPTRAATATFTPPPPATPSPTRTPTPTSSLPMATATFTAESTPTSTVLATATPSQSPTPPTQSCSGDCNGDGQVGIAELVVGVNVVLGRSAVGACMALDRNRDGQVGIGELVAAVNSVLRGCPTPA